MQRIKLALFAYVGVIGLLALAAVVSLAFTPPIERREDTYYQAYWNVPETFDPTRCYETRGGEFIEMCLEGLYDYDGFDNPTEIIPVLAAAMPEISDDRLTYTIRLRPNIRYPDVEPWKGTPRHVRAEDIVFAFKRMADFHQASRHFDHFMRDRVVGANEFFDYTKTVEQTDVDYDREIAGVKALDELTLEITLVRPFPQFVYKLMMAVISPMPREWYMHMTGDNETPEAIQWTLLGTGPYQLAEYQRERKCIFEPNPLYRGRPDIDGHPSGLGGPHPALAPEERMPHEVKRVEFTFNREHLPRWYKFTLGQYDRSRVPRDAFGSAIGVNGELNDELRQLGVVQSLNPRPTVRYLAFAMDIPWLRDNVYLRRAMSLAINRPRYVDVFLNGDGVPSNGIIPHAMNNYNPDHAPPYERYDVKEATRLVTQAREFHRDHYGGELPQLTITMGNTATSSRQRVEDLQIAWKSIGLDVKAEFVEWGKFLEGVRKRQYQMWYLGWVADYPDEETFLSLFYSPNRSPGPNSSCYSNPEYDARYEQAVTMQPGPERLALYNEMIEMIERDVPVVPINYDVIRDLGYDWQGLLDDDGGYYPVVLDHVWMKAKPAYYRLLPDLREARLEQGLRGTLPELLKSDRWSISLGSARENDISAGGDRQ